MKQEELKWRQCAKTDWLTCGNRNSKFFHACANQRQKMNKISQVHDECGRFWENQEQIGGVFENYFDELFSTRGVVDYEGCLGVLEGRITVAMNESLVMPFVDVFSTYDWLRSRRILVKTIFFFPLHFSIWSD